MINLTTTTGIMPRRVVTLAVTRLAGHGGEGDRREPQPARCGSRRDPGRPFITRSAQAALTFERVGRATQQRRSAVGVGVLAQPSRPQRRPGRDPGIQSRRQRAEIARVDQLPVRRPVRERLAGVAGFTGTGPPRTTASRLAATAGSGTTRSSSSCGLRIYTGHQPAADRLMHAQLDRIPPPPPGAIRWPFRDVRSLAG